MTKKIINPVVSIILILMFTISVFSQTVFADSNTISSGTYDAPMEFDYDTIVNGGTFNSQVINYGEINNGTFNGPVYNIGIINGGKFYDVVRNYGKLGDGLVLIETEIKGTGEISINNYVSPVGEERIVSFPIDNPPMGLYLLKNGESIPEDDFIIGEEFTPYTFFDTLIGYKFTPNTDVTVCAVFDDFDPIKIEGICDSKSGAVTGGGTYYKNNSVTLTAVPNKNYVFKYWIETGSDNTIVSYDAEFTFIATEDVSYTAIFEKDSDMIVNFTPMFSLAELKIKNPGTYTVMFADYNSDGTLNAVDYYRTTFAEGSNYATTDISLGKDDVIMLLYDVTNMEPVCERYIIE